MHIAPQSASGPLHHRVPKADNRVAGFGPHVAPAVRVTEDLESAGDVEEHGRAAVVCVAHQAWSEPLTLAVVACARSGDCSGTVP